MQRGTQEEFKLIPLAASMKQGKRAHLNVHIKLRDWKPHVLSLPLPPTGSFTTVAGPSAKTGERFSLVPLLSIPVWAGDVLSKLYYGTFSMLEPSFSTNMLKITIPPCRANLRTKTSTT